ncbi:MAG: hypothetical protein PHU71_05410 [Candidatus Gracilibacteria bacterium]|nr:hypothetical protein [Candidatus Gracilibacteria bacterium]
MEDSVKREISKLKRLVPFKNASDTVLEKAALKNVTLRRLIEDGQFLDDAEKQQAKRFFEAYLLAHEFETQSDLSTLSILVWDEILINRLKKTINDCSTADGKSYVNDKLIKSLNDLTNHVFQIKEKLGIDKEKKEDEFTAFQLLKKRFNQWVNENRDECTLTVPFECASCGKPDVKLVLLRKRVKDFEVIDHSWFQGRFYINKYLIQLVEEGKMSVEDCAKAHNVSIDHIKFTLENKGRIFLNTDDKKSK